VADAIYRPGTGIGGRSADPDLPVVTSDGFAAVRDGARVTLSTDSR
jgi:hypothetical protein